MSLFTHEAVAQYEIEGELAQACPRRVRLSQKTASIAVGAICAYALAGAVAFGFALRSAQLLWLGRFGHVQQARILRFDTLYPTSSPADGAGALLSTPLTDGSMNPPQGELRAYYAFTASGKTYSGWTAVADNSYDADDASAPLSARTAALMPLGRSVFNTGAAASIVVPVRYNWWFGHLIYRPAASIPPIADSAALETIVALALLAGMVYAAFGARRLLQAYFMLRHGDALVATVRDKEIAPGDIGRYSVTYGFIALNGQIVSCRERCTPDQWRVLQIGDPITVMHLPTRGSRLTAGIYRHLPLACAPRVAADRAAAA